MMQQPGVFVFARRKSRYANWLSGARVQHADTVRTAMLLDAGVDHRERSEQCRATKGGLSGGSLGAGVESLPAASATTARL